MSVQIFLPEIHLLFSLHWVYNITYYWNHIIVSEKKNSEMFLYKNVWFHEILNQNVVIINYLYKIKTNCR